MRESPLVREHQQAQLLRILREANGAPVEFAVLRDHGIRFPASVVSELELAGVPVEHCRGADGRGPAVRLDPAENPYPVDDSPDGEATAPPPSDAPRWGPVRVYRTPLRAALIEALAGVRKPPLTIPRPPRALPRPEARMLARWLAPLALLAVAGIAAALLLGGRTAGHAARSRSAHAHPVRHAFRATGGEPVRRPAPSAGSTTPAPSAGSTTSAPSAASTTPAPSSPPPSATVPVSPALATNLEARGHDLLLAGQYAAAIPVLQRAVLASGEPPGACLEPATQTCLTYAYALYDLGRALRLSGRPSEAVPILERRLQIDNQRSVVAAELQLARQGTRQGG